MGILVVGLLGAAALFPVGGYYMQQGDVADRASAIAQAALDDAIVHGHLDPENWVLLDYNPLHAPTTFRPLDEALRSTYFDQSKVVASGVIPDEAKRVIQNYRSGFYGMAYVIDPLGLAGALNEEPSGAISNRIWQQPQYSSAPRRFPATENQTLQYANNGWAPMNSPITSWPVRRVTTTSAVSSLASSSKYFLNAPPAEALFRSDDDLAVLLPESGDQPSRTRWDTWKDNADSYPAARQPRGDYSWLITVTPGSARERDALATQPDAYPCDVSVVVFHKRFLGEGYQGALEAERLVNARVVSTGTSGGELLLDRRPLSEDSVTRSPFEDLRTGQYVMLCGPHPLSTPTNPILFLQWYKVISLEANGQPALAGLSTSAERQLSQDSRVLVGLRGPDWPWRPTDDLSDTDELANDLRVTIIPGAVAVHTKTMRLEAGSAWSVE